MHQSLSKFFVIKSLLYLIAFSVLGYLYINKKPTAPEIPTPVVQSQNTSTGIQQGSVCFEGRCMSVEIANTEARREYGLMNRTSMDSDKGMLFVFEQDGIYPFWMKNTLIPLDMIWIDQQGRVIDIQTATPCTSRLEKEGLGEICPNYMPAGSARYVLELNAGISKLIGLQTGDTLTIKL